MTVGVMQPYFFPYLGYWQLINAVDTYVVYDDVTYIKGGWINRNNILINDRPSMLTLPLSRSSSYRKINEIDVADDQRCVEKLLKTLTLAYAKAPYKKEILPLIEALLSENRNIAALNYEAILKINGYLGIGTEILLSSKLPKKNELKGLDRLIEINKLLGADTYINAIGGVNLYSKDDFAKQGLSLYFLKTRDTVRYRQFKNKFVPNLSIIDVLMFNGKVRTRNLLSEYELV